MTRRLRAALVGALLLCACGGPGSGETPRRPTPARQAPDTSGADLIPAGYGSLHQDDIAVRLQLPAVLVRAIPLDESVIRVLSPDSYRALHELKQGRKVEIDALAGRRGLRDPTLWYISFYGLEPEARFDPLDLVITGSGREQRPLEVLPLSAGFNSQRIRQRETQSAIYLFDEGLDVNQPLVVALDTVRSASWGGTLRTIERERALVRSRASQGERP